MDELETIIEEADFPDTCDPEEWALAFETYVLKYGTYTGEYAPIDMKILRLWFTAALMTGFSRLFDTPYFEKLIENVDKEYVDEKTKKVRKPSKANGFK